MKTGLRYTIYASLFLIPFIPLYVANSLFFPFITGKGFAFRILVEIAFFAWLLLAFADKKYRPTFSWVFVAYGAFVTWMFIADVFAVNPHKALWSNFERMDGWVTMIHVFLFFVVTGAVLSADKLWRNWWMTFLGASALVSLYCLLQLSGNLEIHQGGVRVDGTFGNAAYLAAYLLFAIAVSVWQAFESKGFLRNALFFLAALEVVIVFTTATRGAVLGLVGGAAVAAFLWMLESSAKSRKVAGGTFVAIIALSAGFYMVRDSAFVKSEPTLARVSSISIQDLSVRSTLWGMALKGVAERPITGWGQEGFNYVFNKYYDPALYAQEPWFDRAHDVFIDWLVAGGIPGFLLFIALFITTALALYKREASRAERVLVLAALAAYAIQAIVVFDNLFTYVPLAAILATAHSTSSRKWKKVDAIEQASESTLQVAVPLVAVVAIAIIWTVNIPNISAASELVHALSLQSTDITPNISLFQEALSENTYATQEIREQLVIFMSQVASQQQGPSESLQKLAQYAITEMDKEVALQPLDARLRLESALGYRVTGNYKQALEQVSAAHELSPKKQTILLEQGIEYWQVGAFEEARKSFHQAYELNTSFPALAAYAASGDIAAGHIEEGKALLIQSQGTTTVDSEPLVLAYFQAKQYNDLIAVLQLQVINQNGDPKARFRLASAYLAAGRKSDAQNEINTLVKDHPELSSQVAAFQQSISGVK